MSTNYDTFVMFGAVRTDNPKDPQNCSWHAGLAFPDIRPPMITGGAWPGGGARGRRAEASIQ